MAQRVGGEDKNRRVVTITGTITLARRIKSSKIDLEVNLDDGLLKMKFGGTLSKWKPKLDGV